MTTPTDPRPPGPLVPSDAVAAIIVTPDRRFLMQRRDAHPHIWYPGAWALFGGGIEPGETELEALKREVKEEIDFDVTDATFFTRFHFDLGFAGAGICARAFFEVTIAAEAVATMHLREGAEMRLIEADRVLTLPGMTGYDQFALYLYLNRDRIAAGPARDPRA